MGRRRAFRRRISKQCECWLITKPFVQTIFRFLVTSKDLWDSEIKTNTDLQFKHAFPRCNGERGGELGLEVAWLMVGGFIQIFERVLKSWRPWSFWRIYIGCVRGVGSLSEGEVGAVGNKFTKTDRFIPLVIQES